MPRAICVFCSSSDAVASEYKDLARELGAAIGQRGDTLVYGGCNIGLMGLLARSVHEHGGHVVGIIPRKLMEIGLAYAKVDEQIITDDLRDRKALMDERADSFVALPGGLGTVEEVIEVINLKQLRYHRRPIVFLNSGGFYDRLFHFFEQTFDENFVNPGVRRLYHTVGGVEELLKYLDEYQPLEIEDKKFFKE